MVIALTDAFEHGIYGGKAANLCKLIAGGFQVPPGFVIFGFDEALNLEAVGQEVADRLAEAVAGIGGFPVALRSSGLAEDAQGASHAGVYESFLNIKDVAGLIDCLRRSRAGGNAARLKSYQDRMGVAAGDGSVPMIVQRFIPAQYSGVLFTLHPLSGRDDEVLVEACRGAGDRLMSGALNPCRFVYSLVDGRLLETTPGDDRVPASGLDACRLHALALEVQAWFRHPQDVEWVIDRDDRLWVVQSRPITAINWRRDVCEYSTAYFKDGGVAAHVNTPIVSDLYRTAFGKAMHDYAASIFLLPRVLKGAAWIDEFYGRLYWNAAAVKQMMGKVPGFSEEAFDRDIGISKDYGPGGPVRVPTNLMTILHALPAGIGMGLKIMRWPGRSRRLDRAFGLRIRRWRADADAMGGRDDAGFWQQLFRLLREFYLEIECTYFEASYIQSNAQTQLDATLQKVDALLGSAVSRQRLMSGVCQTEYIEMKRRLCDLQGIRMRSGEASAEFSEALAAFCRLYDYLSDSVLDLTVPRWGEDPSQVLRAVRMEPAAATAASRQGESDQALREIERHPALAGRPLLVRQLRSRLKAAKDCLLIRENLRIHSCQAYYLIRLFLLEAGRRLTAKGLLQRADDIFYVGGVKEIEALAGGRAEGDAVGFHRKRLLGLQDLAIPDELGYERATVGEGCVSSASVLRGIGGSAGIVSGRARVISHIRDIGQLQAGEILVTRFTDPGWTPALACVKGVVTEVGGMLSHAAVIAREFRIPAVLNAGGAMGRIRDGQWLEVNGDLGIVGLGPLG